MSKKIAVLALALGVVAAMVLPASASAVWKHHATPISQNVQIGLTSIVNVGFQSHVVGGGLNCQVTSTVDFTAGQTTGFITTLTPHPTSDTTNCKGEGVFAFCQVHNFTPTGFPSHEGPGWAIHTTGSAQSPTIQITTGEIHSQITGNFCPAGAVTVANGTITARPVDANGALTNGNTVQHIALEGTVFVSTPGGSDAGATIRGRLAVEAPNSATYSL